MVRRRHKWHPDNTQVDDGGSSQPAIAPGPIPVDLNLNVLRTAAFKKLFEGMAPGLQELQDIEAFERVMARAALHNANGNGGNGAYHHDKALPLNGAKRMGRPRKLITAGAGAGNIATKQPKRKQRSQVPAVVLIPIIEKALREPKQMNEIMNAMRAAGIEHPVQSTLNRVLKGLIRQHKVKIDRQLGRYARYQWVAGAGAPDASTTTSADTPAAAAVKTKPARDSFNQKLINIMLELPRDKPIRSKDLSARLISERYDFKGRRPTEVVGWAMNAMCSQGVLRRVDKGVYVLVRPKIHVTADKA